MPGFPIHSGAPGSSSRDSSSCMIFTELSSSVIGQLLLPIISLTLSTKRSLESTLLAEELEKASEAQIFPITESLARLKLEEERHQSSSGVTSE